MRGRRATDGQHSETQDAGAPQLVLRLGTREIGVGATEIVVGREDGCDLVLDDDLVSRRHAAFRESEGRLWVRDLESRNGVKVNSKPIRGGQALVEGDVVRIGKHDFHVCAPAEPPSRRARRNETTIERNPMPSTEESTGLGNWIRVERALVMGELKVAETMVLERLHATLVGVSTGRLGASALADPTRYALRLASESSNAAFIDWIFRAWHAANAVLPVATVDELFVVARKTRYKLGEPIRHYVSGLAARANTLGPSERFAHQRLEGLVRTLRAT